VRRFLLLYKDFDADDGELTRTRKVRRTVVGEKYADLIAAIYQGRSTIDIDTVVTFQGGTRQRVQTRLKNIEVDPTAGAPELVAVAARPELARA